jgi:predicted DNA-binding antitoxin AbrB/MazE fold protein
MNKQFDAIFDNGVFRPLEPVELPQHQRVTVTVLDFEEMGALDAQPAPDNGEVASTDESEDSPWRGVFVPPRKRRVLFSHPLTPVPQELPRRQTSVDMSWHRVTADDE